MLCATRARALLALELCSGWNHAVLNVAPQSNQLAARQGHDANTPSATPSFSKALGEPRRECTVRLVAQPLLSECFQQRAYPSVARLAAALLATSLEALVETGCEPH